MSGVPELLVLRLLASREMYGYEIVKAVRVVTEEAILGPVVNLNFHVLSERQYLTTQRDFTCHRNIRPDWNPGQCRNDGRCHGRTG